MGKNKFRNNFKDDNFKGNKFKTFKDNEKTKNDRNEKFSDFEEYQKNKPKFSKSSGSRGGFKSKIKNSGFELYETKCAKCGRDCDVPFLPTNNKPVYCRSCFRATTPEESGRASSFGRNRDNRSGDRRDRRDDRSRENFRDGNSNSNFVTREEFDQLNKKIDKIMKSLKIN
jgi:CxxC-x17-CxxC domain-containing protein